MANHPNLPTDLRHSYPNKTPGDFSHRLHHDVIHDWINRLAAANKGVVIHGTIADVVRPLGFVSVEWVGSVEPLNALDGDTWVDTTA